MNEKKVKPCPKFGCRGTLEPYGTKVKPSKNRGVGKVVMLWGCDECKYSEEEDTPNPI